MRLLVLKPVRLLAVNLHRFAAFYFLAYNILLNEKPISPPAQEGLILTTF